jgi:hypothetical protein
MCLRSLLVSFLLKGSCLLTILASGAAANTTQAQNLDMLEMMNGFMGATLGDSLHKIPDLKRVGNFEKKTRYRQNPPGMTLEGVTLEWVDYLFYEDRLHSIYMRSLGEESSKVLLKILEQFFGEGKQIGFAPRFEWKTQNVKLVYDRNLLTGNADVRFISLPIDNLFRQVYTVFEP